jgi:GNAT superfamily N-acetyltransferase
VELDDALRDRGFTPDYPWKFEREPEPVATETELQIGDADERFGRVFAAAYGFPATFAGWLGRLAGRTGWRCLAPYEGGEPIATGALFTAGEVGWLGFGATLPSHRGRGTQSALLAARITLAAELGLGLVVTETGVPRGGRARPGPSYRNILRAGFRETYVRPNYAPPA